MARPCYRRYIQKLRVLLPRTLCEALHGHHGHSNCNKVDGVHPLKAVGLDGHCDNQRIGMPWLTIHCHQHRHHSKVSPLAGPTIANKGGEEQEVRREDGIWHDESRENGGGW